MGNAFQDQLLKAGLVDEKKVKQAQKEKRRQQKQGKQQSATDQNKLAAQRAKAEQAERDRELNRKRQEEQKERETRAQIKQLIEQYRQPREEAEVPYSFVDNGLIKKTYVTEEQQGLLSRGRLAIVKWDGRYELVPPEAAEKIRQRDETSVILLNTASAPQDAEDDPYAEFKVPDDLMW